MSQSTMTDPWIPSAFTPSDEFKEFALDNTLRLPQAFQLLPIGNKPEENHNSWACYEFDGKVNLWIDTHHPETLEFYRQTFKKQKGKTMSKALTVQEDSQVKAMLKANIQAIKSVLPHHLTPEKMARMAYTAIVKTPALARCSQLSLFNAVLEAASIGLEIGGPLSLAHLIPFKGEATLIVDYKGLIELAYKSPKVKSFTAHPVYENDEFEYWYGLNKDIRHRPSERTKGSLTHAYAIVEFTGGGADFEVVNKEDAMKAKSKSPAKNSNDSPWNKPDEEWTMWVKTAVRRLMKRIPKSSELQKALDMDEKEAGKNNSIIDVDFDTMKDLKGKDISGNDVSNQDEGQDSKAEKQTSETKPTRDYTEKEHQALQSLAVIESDPEFNPIYKKACQELKVDPSGSHSPATAQKLLEIIGRISSEK